MNDADYDEHDLAFLVSRSLDETLPEQARRRLDAALVRSEALRRDAEQLAAVHRLIARWAAHRVEIDWDRQVEQVLAQAADDDEASLGGVDELLRRWGDAPRPPIPSTFVEGVLQRLSGGTRRSPRLASIFRMGVPLAAAAAIALAFVGTDWFAAPAPALSVVHFRGSTATVQPTGRAVVSFGRAPAPGGAARFEPGALTFSVVGAGARPSMYSEEPLP